MNDKTTLKLIKIIMGDKSITDNDKIEAVKKLAGSITTYHPYYPYSDPYPITYQPQWTCTDTTSGNSTVSVGFSNSTLTNNK